VLFLHDATDFSMADVVVAKLASIKPERIENHPAWYRRLREGCHPTQHLLQPGSLTLADTQRGSYVDARSVAVIRKSTILRRIGKLDSEQMTEVSERLITAWEIDISRRLDSLQPPGSIQDDA
jgi:hypothetical protein